MLGLDLLSVNVGKPAPLGVWQGEQIISGIRKFPVEAVSIGANSVNLDGDEQADLTVHGGVDKAIYAYPADNWPWWRETAHFAATPASFGENLTTRGGDEDHVRIGDVFAWDGITLQVSQPRAPCFKFAMLTGREDMPGRMTVSARTGWYFRVLETGSASTHGQLVRMASDEQAPSVRDAFMALFHPRVAAEVVERTLAAPALAEVWRRGIVRRLHAASRG
jgi:MOSC domain-containing protein YiiM